MEYDVVPNPNKRPVSAKNKKKKMSLDSDEEDEEEYSEYDDDDDEDFEWSLMNPHYWCTFNVLVFSIQLFKSSK